MNVAALYVDVERGPYAGMAGVDAWGVERDARLYRGPHPVVAQLKDPPAGVTVFRELRAEEVAELVHPSVAFGFRRASEESDSD